MCCVSMTNIAHPPVSMMHRMKCPPRKGNLWGSFHLHKTAAYQAGHIWRQALQPAPVLPSTCDWQWIKGPRSQNSLLNTCLPQFNGAPEVWVLAQKGWPRRCKCVKACVNVEECVTEDDLCVSEVHICRTVERETKTVC